MKKTILILTAAAIAVAGTTSAQAGDKEWATAGKVLTGVVAGTVLAKTVFNQRSAPVYTQTTVYSSPAYRTAPVVVEQPVVVETAPVVVQRPVVVERQVVYQPATVVYKPAPVVYQPAPVVVRHAPVICPTPVVVSRPVCAPRPSGFSLQIGFGGGYRSHGHPVHGYHPGRGHGHGHHRGRH